MIKKWDSYQKTLSKLVKSFSGYTVDEKLRIDIENLFLDILNKNFDNVNKKELEDIKGLLPHLVETNPIEYNNALKINKNKKYLKTNI